LPGRVRKHLIINGRVQGVGFRAFLRQQARKYQISGWVKNRIDGSVEAVLEGEETGVEEMVNKAREGPRWARVDKVEVFKGDYQGEFADFFIK
jgi:acylphosphatase